MFHLWVRSYFEGSPGAAPYRFHGAGFDSRFFRASLASARCFSEKICFLSSKYVQREYDLQERVFNALSNLQEAANIRFERGRDVDFLVHLSDDSSVGIDIKTKFGKHAFKEIDSFIAGKLEVPKLILLVFDSIPPRLIRQTRDLTATGKIQLASITDSDAQSLESRLAALLGTAPANA